jgi:bacteriocin biosynthesis cyclodehydratase domain-containing protein
MDIRFDPRFPLVWRDPQTLQIGVDRPVVVLDSLTSRQERIVAAIAAGHGRSGLAGIVHHSGCRESDVTTLVSRVTPALVVEPNATGPQIAIAGSCALADEIDSLLRASGLVPSRVDVETVALEPVPALGIAVSHHVHEPALVGSWLRRDIPHLCVVSGDVSTRIGPLVVPGRTACTHCLDLHRSDVDTAWGVIAGQLWGRRPVDSGMLATRDVAVRTVRRAIDHLLGEPRRTADAVIDTIEQETGAVTRSTSRPHPACGCAALPRNDSAGGPSPRAPGRHDSTRGAGVRVPA